MVEYLTLSNLGFLFMVPFVFYLMTQLWNMLCLLGHLVKEDVREVVTNDTEYNKYIKFSFAFFVMGILLILI